MWATVVGWFFGGGLTKIGQLGLDFYKQKLSAENSTEAYVTSLAQKSLDIEAQQAQINNQLLIAEQGNWFTRNVRPLWALPFIIYTWKVVVWDLVLGLGSTPTMHGTVATLMTVVAGSYFGSRGLEKIAQTWATYRRDLTARR